MRNLILLLILSLLFYSCRKSALQKISGSEYFPNSVGNYWKYRFTDSISSASYFIHVNIIGNKLLSSGQNARVWIYSYPTHRDTEYVYQDNDTIKIVDQWQTIRNTYVVPLQLNNKWKAAYYKYDSIQVIENRPFTLNNQSFDNSSLLFRTRWIPNDYWNRSEWFCPNIGMITRNDRGMYTITNQPTNEYWELVEYVLK